MQKLLPTGSGLPGIIWRAFHQLRLRIVEEQVAAIAVAWVQNMVIGIPDTAGNFGIFTRQAFVAPEVGFGPVNGFCSVPACS